MLTNQIIGAGQNVASHTPRSAAPTNPVSAPGTPAPGTDAKPADQITPVAILPQTKAPKTETSTQDRPTLQLPKRAEMQIAVPDTIPDAQPESVYNAKAEASLTKDPE